VELEEATAGPAYISTGHLPEADRVGALVAEVHALVEPEDDGAVSAVYPALAAADPDRFGICLIGVDGTTWSAGQVDDPFTLMSVSKPFTFALLCERVGTEVARTAIGVDATGLPFDSVAAVERSDDGRTNPMVNAGAIATVAAWAAAVAADAGGPVGVEDLWAELSNGFERFTGHRLELDEATYRSASATNLRNRALVQLLDSLGAMPGDGAVALDLYTRQCCLSVTARDLASMGATLAHGGIQPATDERVVDQETCRCTLAVMATAGMYETSGDWLYRVGLPAKSGIGGGIVTASPGKGALGTFSPRLDPAGNSVRGTLATAALARRLGLDLFSTPDT
jgi:glutaminase